MSRPTLLRWTVLRWTVLVLAMFVLVVIVDALSMPLVGEEFACSTVGCEDELEIVLEGEVPAHYDLTIAEGSKRITLSCRDDSILPGSLERIEAGEGIYAQGYDSDTTDCTARGVFIDGFAPERFEVTVSWEGGSTSQTFRPEYELCSGNCCSCATVTIQLP